MCTADDVLTAGRMSGGPAGKLRLISALLDEVNSAELVAAGCGDLLVTWGEVQAKITAGQARTLRCFDAADAHDS